MEFSRQEYWSGLPFPSPGDLSDLGMEPGSPALQADSLPSEPAGKPTLHSLGTPFVFYLLPFNLHHIFLLLGTSPSPPLVTKKGGGEVFSNQSKF